MVTVVLIFNVALAGLCWYGAWRIWRLRRTFAEVADGLTLAEQQLYHLLHETPSTLLQAQQSAQQWRYQYGIIQGRIQQVQQFMALLGLGRLVWQQYSARSTARARGRSASARFALVKSTSKSTSEPAKTRNQRHKDRN
jgi:hypothetical protein